MDIEITDAAPGDNENLEDGSDADENYTLNGEDYDYSDEYEENSQTHCWYLSNVPAVMKVILRMTLITRTHQNELQER
jgi:hypothetical protein